LIFPAENGNLDQKAISLSLIDGDLDTAGSHVVILDAGAQKWMPWFAAFLRRGLMMPSKSPAEFADCFSPPQVGSFRA